MLRERGFTVLMVEQNFRFASRVADRFYVIEEGHVVDQFARDDIARRPAAHRGPARALSATTRDKSMDTIFGVPTARLRRPGGHRPDQRRRSTR